MSNFNFEEILMSIAAITNLKKVIEIQKIEGKITALSLVSRPSNTTKDDIHPENPSYSPK